MYPTGPPPFSPGLHWLGREGPFLGVSWRVPGASYVELVEARPSITRARPRPMKLLAVLVPCACLPLAAALLGSSEAGGGAAPARLSHRPVRPLPEVVEEPVQLVAPPSEPAVRAVSEREDLRRAAPTPPPREVVQVAEAPSGLDALPPSAREVVRLRAVLEEPLVELAFVLRATVRPDGLLLVGPHAGELHVLPPGGVQLGGDAADGLVVRPQEQVRRGRVDTCDNAQRDGRR